MVNDMIKKRESMKGNIIDIVIVVILIAVVALAVVKMTGSKSTAIGAVDSDQDIVLTTYTGFIDQVRMATVNAFHEGDKLFDKKTGVYIGDIMTIEHEPMYRNVPDGEGGLKKLVFPDYYSVTLTIDGPIVEEEQGYFIGDSVELKANSEMKVYTKYAMPIMKVSDIAM